MKCRQVVAGRGGRAREISDVEKRGDGDGRILPHPKTACALSHSLAPTSTPNHHRPARPKAVVGPSVWMNLEKPVSRRVMYRKGSIGTRRAPNKIARDQISTVEFGAFLFGASGLLPSTRLGDLGSNELVSAVSLASCCLAGLLSGFWPCAHGQVAGSFVGLIGSRAWKLGTSSPGSWLCFASQASCASLVLAGSEQPPAAAAAEAAWCLLRRTATT